MALSSTTYLPTSSSPYHSSSTWRSAHQRWSLPTTSRAKFFTEDEINKLAVVCPNIRVVVIRDYKVAEKIEVTLPETLTDIVKCANPVCITNNEPMRTVFYRKDSQTLKCRYCGKEQKIADIKLK